MPKTDCRFIDNEFTYEGLVAKPPLSRVRAGTSFQSRFRTSTSSRPRGKPGDRRTQGVGGWRYEDGLLAQVTAELISRAVNLASHLGGGVAALLISST